MISFCCPFYPWYRDHDRSDEVLDILISGLNSINGVEDLELCFVDAGVIDVWRFRDYQNSRLFNSTLFEEEISQVFKGKLKYLLDEGSIHRDRSKVPRFWAAKAIQTAVDISSNDYIVIVGIDCHFTSNFAIDFFKRVKKGQAWVILSTACDKFNDIKLIESSKIVRRYYTSKGIVGISKKDFYDIGGYNLNYIKDKSDSNFFDRLSHSNINVLEERVNTVYHIWHEGSHMPKQKEV